MSTNVTPRRQHLLNFMPQFDIASFYPQITFFAGTFLMFYAYVNKDVLPMLGQGLKMNRKLVEMFASCAGQRPGDIGLLSYIYIPSRRPQLQVTFAEIIYLIHSCAFAKALTLSYVAALRGLKAADSRARLLKFSTLYLIVLAGVF